MHKYFLIYIISFLLLSCKVTDQKCKYEYDRILKKNIYTTYDIYPKYPDGEIELLSNVLKDLIVLEPENLQTKVVVSITIDEQGEPIVIGIKNKKISDYSLLDREVIKKLEGMKNWIPAKCKNKNVATIIYIPIHIDYKSH